MTSCHFVILNWLVYESFPVLTFDQQTTPELDRKLHLPTFDEAHFVLEVILVLERSSERVWRRNGLYRTTELEIVSGSVAELSPAPCSEPAAFRLEWTVRRDGDKRWRCCGDALKGRGSRLI